MTNPPEWNASLADVLIGCELDMFICSEADLFAPTKGMFRTGRREYCYVSASRLFVSR